MLTASRPGVTPRAARSWFARGTFFLCSLFMLGWSGHAAASLGCELDDTSSSSFQSGPVNGQLSYSFQIIDTGGCSGTASGTIAIQGTDGTQGATSNVVNWSGITNDIINVTITLGPQSGGTAQFLVDCDTNCSGSTTQLTWFASTFNDWQLTPTTSQNFTVLTGQAVALGVNYTIDGNGSFLTTSWIVDVPPGFVDFGNVATDASGNANNVFRSYSPGTYQVTASGDCPAAAGPPGPASTTCPPPSVMFTINVEDAEITPVQPASGSATISQNGSIVLKVKYAGPTISMPDGTQVDWVVDSEPGAGASSFTGPNPSTTNNGFTQITLNTTVPGDYVIRAEDCPDGCEGQTYFTITVLPIDSDLSISKSGSPNPVAPGGQLSYSIAVNNAGPNPAINPTWTDTLPAAVSFVSLTAPAGWNCSTPAVGSGGTVSCTRNTMLLGTTNFTLVTQVSPSAAPGSTISNTASVSSTADGNAANNSATATNSVAATAASLAVSKVLTGTSDNDGSGAVSTGDQLDYEVTATNNGNVSLNNVVVSDDHFAATQTCPTLAPSATCVLTGSYIVTAADTAAGSVTNIGKATSTEVPGPISSSVITPIVVVEPALAIGSGDGQSTPPNTPFPLPLTVIAGGSPPIEVESRAGQRGQLNATAQPGVTINWQVISGSAELTSPTSVTNASGIASNTVTAGPTPGPVVVRATRNDPIPSLVPASVDFHLTVLDLPEQNLGDLPGLTENQQALADALDELCSGSPSTGGGGSTERAGGLGTASTPSEDDLQARCQELIDAIGTDPSGVIDALDQLFADIALIQSESSLLAAQSQFDNIKARIAALRSGTGRTSFGGLALNTSSGRLPIGTMFQSLMQAEAPAGTAKEVGSDFSRWGFFAAGTIGRGNADAGSLSPAYDFDIGGLTVGADYRKSDKLIFGGTLGYTSQDNKLRGSDGSLGTKGWSVSAYGTWYQQNSWYMDGVFSYGRNSYDIERRVRYTITGPSGTTTIDQTGHANGDGDSMTFALSVGRDFNKGGWGFGPYLRAMWTEMSFDPLVEEFDQSVPGIGLALELDSRNVTSISSTLGGKLTYAHSASWGVLIPHVQLEWQHEFESDPSEVEARFLFDPLGTPFTIKGDPIDTDFFRFGVGMSFVMTKGRSGFFYYERLISRERFSQNSLALGIRLEF